MVAISVWAIALLATIGVTSAADPIHLPLRRTEGYHKSLNRRATASPVQLYNAARQGGYGIDLTIGTPGTFYLFFSFSNLAVNLFFLHLLLCLGLALDMAPQCSPEVAARCSFYPPPFPSNFYCFNSIPVPNRSICLSAQTFTVIIDTGSTELWVPGPACPKTECFDSLFNSSLSTSYVATTNPINLAYTLGSFNGTYGRDIVSIGPYTTPNMTFGVIESTANNSSPVPGEPYLNGVFGLAFPTLTYSSETLQFQYDPFIFALWKANQIPQSIFSIYLGSRLIEGETGVITFGGVDNSKYSGSLNWLKVQKEADSANTSNYYHWNILLVGLAATMNGKQSSNLLSTSGAVTLLDTGTTFSFMPYTVVANMLTNVDPSAIYTQGAFYVDCSLASSTGTIDFAFANTTAGTSATVISASVSSLVIPLDSLSPSTAQQCVWGILPEDGVYLLGDTFLQSVYVVHDFVNYSVGIAAASWTNSTATTSGGSATGTSGPSSSPGSSPVHISSAQSVSGSAVRMLSSLALVACICLLL
jgi:Eukaryotic aspartyl protease